ncbi:MAG TPA: phosphate ABC transporter substrate-binding protein PstS [Gemmatimonadales bacterium]|nr:phosphate ABC transporter substrate-binding protein PstS [Gemmatimonadales bacterium]
MTIQMLRGTALLLAVGLVAAACGGERGGAPGAGAAAGAPTSGGSAALTGAGATFPSPIYQKWFDTYAKQTGVKINYQSIGSGGGIRQFTEGTVDFGATDGPMTDAQIQAAQGNVLHLPTVLGAVVLTYNLPALGQTKLRLDGPTIADIYLGTITKWDDRRIAALNPGVQLPSMDIIVVHRSDGSGTSFIFTDYLSKVSPQWQRGPGKGTSLAWPTGLGGKGNEGVTQQVKQTEGGIGYVELIYAVSNNLAYASVKNRANAFVEPTVASVTAAAASAELGADTDFRVSITDAPGADAYPIASFTWLLVHKQMPDPAKAKALHDFLGWMLGADAQRQAAELHYAPLPAKVIDLERQRLAALQGS